MSKFKKNFAVEGSSRQSVLSLGTLCLPLSETSTPRRLRTSPRPPNCACALAIAPRRLPPPPPVVVLLPVGGVRPCGVVVDVGALGGRRPAAPAHLGHGRGRGRGVGLTRPPHPHTPLTTATETETSCPPGKRRKKKKK